MDRFVRLRRRDLIVRCAGAGAIAALGLTTGSGAARAAGNGLDIARATSDTFAHLLGDPFRLIGGKTQPRLVELAAVTPVSWAPGRDDRGRRFRRAFSLLFRDPMGPALVEGTYRLTHRIIGSFSLFIVPAGLVHGGLAYDAILG